MTAIYTSIPSRRRISGALLLLFLITGIVIVAELLLCPEQGLYGVYYPNANWEGEPRVRAVETEITSETLRARRAEMPHNIYSVEWKGFIDIPHTDFYTFATTSDDGSWLLIDGNPVVDNGGAHGKRRAEGKIHLLKGTHEISIRYFQKGGYAVLHLAWAQEFQPEQPLTARWLYPPDTNTFGVKLYHAAAGALPVLAGLWTVVVLAAFGGAYWRLRHSRRAGRRSLAATLRMVILQPLALAWQLLKHPSTWCWMLVLLYTLIIFLTLSYAREFSDRMIERYGADIFSKITVNTLIAAGILMVILLPLFGRHRFLTRLLWFLGIAVIYAFLLSPTLRTTIFTGLRQIGINPHFLESLDVYPIYAGEKIHFLEYGGLGVLLCLALGRHIKNIAVYPLAMLLVYLTGMADEAIQWALPSRVGEYRDIWINITSGSLAIIAVLLVIRPKALTQRFRRTSLRPFFYVLAVAFLCTGLFLQYVHGFGSAIFMPDIGSEFVSAFPEETLLRIDDLLKQRAEGQLAEDVPENDQWMYWYEAQRHQFLRDVFYKQERFFESYCEQEILNTYFRARVSKHHVPLNEYDTTQFAISPDPAQRVFFRSEGQELSITAYKQETMWSVVLILAVLSALIAASLAPGRSHYQALRGTPVPRWRLERQVLRPLFALLLLLVFGYALLQMRAPDPPEHVNLLILTVDSCQPDYFGAYGYPQNTTPFFDELAEEGVLFSQAISASSWTIPSLVSMLTGVNPNVHGIDVRGKLMDPRVPTLFEALEEAGYTIGDTSYTLTEPSVNSVFKKTDISPDSALSEGRSEESYLLSWLEMHQDEPFFAWTHFHTVHLPYKANPPYSYMFDENIDPEVLQDEQIKFVLSNVIIRKGEVEFDLSRHAPVVRSLFTQALRQQDAKVGKVLMKLDELGLRDNTIIMITADHGEELMEHGFVGHASTSWDGTVYDDLIHVPLLIAYPPKFPQGKRIEEQVRIIDLMPTALDVLNVPFDKTIQGKSLLPLIQEDAAFQETAFAETTPCGYSCPSRLEDNRLRAVRTPEWKLIATYNAAEDDTAYALYDLRNDPDETTDVQEQHPEVVAELQEELAYWQTAPSRFPYQHSQSEEPHYLDVDVEVRPIILFPKVGTVVTPETHNKRVLLEWIGDENMEYLIEYDVGTGGYHMEGQIEVKGTQKWFGPLPEDIWQALPLYNPFKFRVMPKQYQQFPSDWITFEIQSSP